MYIRRFVFMLLLFSIRGMAQQVPDTAFESPIQHPHFEKGKGPVLAIDQAHHNFHRLDGRFAAFDKLLHDDGYSVKKNEHSFSKRGLGEMNVGNIQCTAFTKEEINAVNKWVQDWTFVAHCGSYANGGCCCRLCFQFWNSV